MGSLSAIVDDSPENVASMRLAEMMRGNKIEMSVMCEIVYLWLSKNRQDCEKTDRNECDDECGRRREEAATRR